MKPGTLSSDLGLRTGADYDNEVLVGTPGYFAQKRVQLTHTDQRHILLRLIFMFKWMNWEAIKNT